MPCVFGYCPNRVGWGENTRIDGLGHWFGHFPYLMGSQKLFEQYQLEGHFSERGFPKHRYQKYFSKCYIILIAMRWKSNKSSKMCSLMWKMSSWNPIFLFQQTSSLIFTFVNTCVNAAIIIIDSSSTSVKLFIFFVPISTATNFYGNAWTTCSQPSGITINTLQRKCSLFPSFRNKFWLLRLRLE